MLDSPPLYAVDNFFSNEECHALMTLAGDYMVTSPVVGAGAGEISESRTSSSCFLAREDLPTVCSKVPYTREDCRERAEKGGEERGGAGEA